MLRYDIFPGTESTNGFLGTIWQSDNWPTTWKKWKTVRLNCLSSSDPNTSFMKCTSEAFLYTEVKNARVRGSLLPCLRPRSGGLPQSQTYHLSLSQNKGKNANGVSLVSKRHDKLWGVPSVPHFQGIKKTIGGDDIVLNIFFVYRNIPLPSGNLT